MADEKPEDVSPENPNHDKKGRFRSGNRANVWSSGKMQAQSQRMKFVIHEILTDKRLRNLIYRVYLKARQGDHKSLRFLAEYGWGKPRQEIETTVHSDPKNLKDWTEEELYNIINNMKDGDQENENLN